MTKQEARERAEFLAVMRRELPKVGDIETECDRLVRLAKQHGRICERECNRHQTPSGDWDEAAAKRDELLCDKVEKQIAAVCERIGCKPLFSGDPRGATVMIIIPSGYSNSWGGEGVCVPQ